MTELLMFEVDVKNVTHLCKKRVRVKEGRSEGGDQARFFMWIEGHGSQRKIMKCYGSHRRNHLDTHGRPYMV